MLCAFGSDAAADVPVLVLEDDAVFPKILNTTLELVLEQLRTNNISNYVVKLHELKPIFIYAEWSEVFKAGGYNVSRRPGQAHAPWGGVSELSLIHI